MSKDWGSGVARMVPPLFVCIVWRSGGGVFFPAMTVDYHLDEVRPL